MVDLLQELEKFLESGLAEAEPDRASVASFESTWSSDKRKALRAARMLPFSKLHSTRDVLNALHRLNLGLQSQQHMFRLIEQYVKSSSIGMANDDPPEQRSSQLKRKLKQRILKLCSDSMLKSGIAGEIPVHVAYLMGEHELGVEMIRAASFRLAFQEIIDEAEYALLKQELQGEETVESLKRRRGYPELYKEKHTVAFSVRLWTEPSSAPFFCRNRKHPCVKPRPSQDNVGEYWCGEECMTCGRPVCRTCEYRDAKQYFRKKCVKCGEEVCNICGECRDWRNCRYRNQPVVESTEWQTMLLELDLEPEHDDSYKDEGDLQSDAGRWDRGPGIRFRLFQRGKKGKGDDDEFMEVTKAGMEVGKADILQDIDRMYDNLDDIGASPTESNLQAVDRTISIDFRKPITCMLNPSRSYSKSHVRRIDFRLDKQDAHEKGKVDHYDRCSRRWALLRTIFDVEAIRKRFDIVQARIINTPYVSDLEKWLLSDKESSDKDGASYLQHLCDNWGQFHLKVEAPNNAEGSSYVKQSSMLAKSPSAGVPAGEEGHKKLEASNGNSFRKGGPTMVRDFYEEQKRKKKEMKNLNRLKRFLKHIETSSEVHCTIGACALPMDEEKARHQRIRRCGLLWESMPADGEEHFSKQWTNLCNEKLVKMLQSKVGASQKSGDKGAKVLQKSGKQDVVALTEKELDSVDDGQLTYASYIEIESNKFYRPKVELVQCSKCGGKGGKAGGLFSGETILHIAIVQHRMSSIEWLLRNGAHVDDRALGLFFQDALIPKFQNDISFVQRHGFEPWKFQANELGGACNYGQYPLSFAAAVGDEHVCHLLCQRAEYLIHVAVYEFEELPSQYLDSKYFHAAAEVRCLKAELDSWVRNNIQDGNKLLHSLQNKIAQKTASKVPTSDRLHQRYVELLLSAFLNRRDSAGNTALHLAVRHRRISTIDWLLQNGATPSLKMLNNDNYTPLTLAVRQGDVKTFDHLFAKQRQRVWSYGTVCMAIMPLEQVDTFRITPSIVGPEGETIPDPSVLRKSNGFKRFLRLYVLPEFLGGIPRGPVKSNQISPTDGLHYMKDSFTRSIAHMGSSMSSLFGIGHQDKDSVLHQNLKAIIEGKEPPVYLVRESKDEQNADTGAYLHQDECWRSALEIVVEHEINAFINDKSIFVELVDRKWRKWGRRYHIWNEVVPFALFTTLITAGILYRLAMVWHREISDMYTDSSMPQNLAPYDAPERYKDIVILLYGTIFCGGIPFLLYKMVNERRFKVTDLDPNEDLTISFVEIVFWIYKNLDMLLSFAIVFALTVQGSLWLLKDEYWDAADMSDGGGWDVESRLMGFIVIFTWLKMLHLLLPFQTVGRVLITVWRMLMSDVTKWICIFSFVLIAFSLATSIIIHKNYILHRSKIPTDSEGNMKQFVMDGDNPIVPFDQMLSYTFVMLGEVQHLAVTTSGFSTWDQKIIHILYNIVATLLLQNLIIAMMSDTYASERQAEGYAMWWMNHASTVLRYQNRLPRHKRIRYRSGTDNNPGADYPECRSFFQVIVGPDEQMEDAWSVDEKEVSTGELQTYVTQRFHEVDAKLHDTVETLHQSINVRYRRLDAKLNTLFRLIKPSSTRPQSPTPRRANAASTGASGADQGAASSHPQSQTPRRTMAASRGASGTDQVAGPGSCDVPASSPTRLSQSVGAGRLSNGRGSWAGSLGDRAKVAGLQQNGSPRVRGEEVHGQSISRSVPNDFVANLFQRCDKFSTGCITREQMCWIVIQVLDETGRDDAAVADPQTEDLLRLLIAAKTGNDSVTIRELAAALQVWIPQWQSDGVDGLRRLAKVDAQGSRGGSKAWYDSGQGELVRAPGNAATNRLAPLDADNVSAAEDRSFDVRSSVSSTSSGLLRTGRKQARDRLRPLPGAPDSPFSPSRAPLLFARERSRVPLLLARERDRKVDS